DGIRDLIVTGVQTCALPIWPGDDDVRGMALEQPIPLLVAVDVEIQHVERLQIALDIRSLLLRGRRGILRTRTPGGKRGLGADREIGRASCRERGQRRVGAGG